VLLQDVGAGADLPLLEIAVLFQDLLWEEHRDGLGQGMGHEHVGRLHVQPHRVLVRGLDPLDLLEVERLDAFLGVGLEAVLHVGRGELAPVERRDVLPLHALPELEGPDPRVGAGRPRLGEVPLEGHVDGPARLVREDVPDQPITGQPGELVEAHRLGEPWVEHGRIPAEARVSVPPRLAGLGARGNPLGIG
jgi:hypothetical protein